MKDSRHHPRESIGHGVKGRAACGQIHSDPCTDAYRGPGADPPLIGAHHHHQGGAQPSNGQIPSQSDLGQGEQHRSSQNEQAHGLPDGEGVLLPVLRPGGEGDAVEIGRRARQQHLGPEKNEVLGRPPPVREIDKPGDPIHERGGGRHKPHLAVRADVIEGKGHREDQNGRRRVAQPLHKALEEQIPHTGAQQRAESIQSRARRGHQPQSEGRIVSKNPRARQNASQEEAHGTLCTPHQNGRTEHQAPSLPHLLTDPGCPGSDRLLCCHFGLLPVHSGPAAIFCVSVIISQLLEKRRRNG